MKMDIKVILIIIITSSLLGLIYNYFSPKGIALVVEEKKLKWADDSLFNSNVVNEFRQKDTTTSKKQNSPESVSLPLQKEKENNQEKTSTEHEKKLESDLSEPAAIHIKQAYNLYQQNVLFIDAREPTDYQNSHINNSINIPFDHFDDYKHLLNDIEKEKIIVTYCAGTDCDLSKLLGNILFEMGYKKVYIFFGGWNEWLEANYPVESESEG